MTRRHQTGRRWRRVAALPALVLVMGSALVATSAGTASALTAADCRNPIESKTITASKNGNVLRSAKYLEDLKPQPGETVTVTWKARKGCEGMYVGLASYRSPTPKFDGSAPTQELYRSDQGKGGGVLTVLVPTPAGSPAPGCTNTHDLSQDGNGANVSGPYDTTCDGTPSANGEGSSTSRPCAGCVGNADNKNPRGQQPGPQDGNNGYECDGNNGIAKGNPAHSGCTEQDHYQVDLFSGDFQSANVIQELSSTNLYGKRLLSAYNG